MSLVRDALAKAEREAAARSAREKGLPAALSEIQQPYRARRRARGPWAFGVVAATVAVVAALVALRPETDPGPEPAVAAGFAEAPASDAEFPSAAGTSPHAALGSAASPPPGESSPSYRPPTAPASLPATTVSGPAIGSTASAAGTEAPSTSGLEAPATSSVADRPRAPSSSPVPSGSFVREVTLGDGRAIALGGIAWSKAAPLAYLNGRLVGIGEYVEGFRVAVIEREQVVLDSGDDRPAVRFSIRLR